MSQEFAPNPNALPPRPKSSGTKWLLGCGLGCGVFMLLCCGVGVYGVYSMQSYFEDSFIKDPVIAKQKSDEIAKIDLPDSFEPLGFLELRLPIVDIEFVKMGVWGTDELGGEGHDLCIIAEFNGDMMGEHDMSEMSDSIEQSMQQQGQGQGDVIVDERSQLNVKIRDQDVQFQIAKGHLEKTNEPVWQAIGVFQGETGPVLVMLVVRQENMSEEELHRVLESIE